MMRALFVMLLFVGSVALSPACSEDSCKNPKKIDGFDPEKNFATSGPAIQCHAVVICPRKGGGYDKRTVLQGPDDPIIVDRGSSSWNRDGCRKSAMNRGLVGFECRVEASPEMICLDVAGGPGEVGSTLTGGTIVTVGAGSGDFHSNGDDTAGIGGFSAAQGREMPQDK